METLITIGIALIILFIIVKIFKTLIKWALIVVLALLVIGFFTNPDGPTHRESLKNAIKNLPVKVRDRTVKIEDYKIFSLTKVKVQGEERIVGVGVFGKVWYFDDIENRLKKKKRRGREEN